MIMRFLQGTISYPEVKWATAEERAVKNTPLIDFVDQLAEVGADGIELWGRHLDNLDEAEIEALSQAIEKIGQRVMVLAPYWDFSSSDEAVEASLADADRYLLLKDVFGCDMLRVFSGAPASAESTPLNWERAINGLGRLARMYEGTGVTFVIETHSQQLADTPQSSRRLMEELDEPTVRLNYQNMQGDPVEELDAVYPWVSHCHVNTVKQWSSTVEAVMGELTRRGYNGAVTCEFCTDSLPGENEQFDRAKAIDGMRADIALFRSLAG